MVFVINNPITQPNARFNRGIFAGKATATDSRLVQSCDRELEELCRLSRPLALCLLARRVLSFLARVFFFFSFLPRSLARDDPERSTSAI